METGRAAVNKETYRGSTRSVANQGEKMQTTATQLPIVDGTELTTTSWYVNVGGGAGANQGLGLSTTGYYTWPYTTQPIHYTYNYPPSQSSASFDVQMRFVENGVLVSFKGKEYVFKDVVAAANHIMKLRG